MQDFLTKRKTLFTRMAEKSITVRSINKDGAEVTHRFHVSNIAGITSTGPNSAAITLLYNGDTLHVPLSYQELKKKIYDGTTDSVDFSFCTGLKTMHAGDVMPDGSIYVGISPRTVDPMYTTPADAPAVSLYKSAHYAAKLKAHGHTDWHVPTLPELNVLYSRQYTGALKGTFNSQCGSSRFYASSTPYRSADEKVYIVAFDSGIDVNINIYNTVPFRCVRTAPPLTVSYAP